MTINVGLALSNNTPYIELGVIGGREDLTLETATIIAHQLLATVNLINERQAKNNIPVEDIGPTNGEDIGPTNGLHDEDNRRKETLTLDGCQALSVLHDINESVSANLAKWYRLEYNLVSGGGCPHHQLTYAMISKYKTEMRKLTTVLHSRVS